MTHSAFPKFLMMAALAVSAMVGIAREPVDWVNGKIGSIPLMIMPTFPATQLPNGMLRFTPPNRSFVTDRVGPLNLAVPAFRNRKMFTLAPVNDWKGAFGDWTATWDNQRSRPHRYSVLFDSEEVAVDLVPARRSAVVAFTFEGIGNHAVVLGLNYKGRLKLEGAKIVGQDDFKGLPVHITAEFDVAPGAWQTKDDRNIAAVFGEEVKTVKMRYAISFISREQSERNLRGEIRDWDMERLAKAARDEWNKVLGQIEVEGGTDDQKTVFYTALWRCYERMVNFTEDGKYMGYDRKVHDAGGVDYYSDDWVWDTYRAMHPLMALLRPKAQAAKMTSFLRMTAQTKEGWVPTNSAAFQKIAWSAPNPPGQYAHDVAVHKATLMACGML